MCNKHWASRRLRRRELCGLPCPAPGWEGPGCHGLPHALRRRGCPFLLLSKEAEQVLPVISGTLGGKEMGMLSPARACPVGPWTTEASWFRSPPGWFHSPSVPSRVGQLSLLLLGEHTGQVLRAGEWGSPEGSEASPLPPRPGQQGSLHVVAARHLLFDEACSGNSLLRVIVASLPLSVREIEEPLRLGDRTPSPQPLSAERGGSRPSGVEHPHSAGLRGHLHSSNEGSRLGGMEAGAGR